MDKYLRQEDWHVWATMTKGHVTMPVFQSLEAFWPGMLTLVGEELQGHGLNATNACINGGMLTLVGGCISGVSKAKLMH